jgi:hypothetical protein
MNIRTNHILNVVYKPTTVNMAAKRVIEAIPDKFIAVFLFFFVLVTKSV